MNRDGQDAFFVIDPKMTEIANADVQGLCAHPFLQSYSCHLAHLTQLEQFIFCYSWCRIWMTPAAIHPQDGACKRRDEL
jgi:hypothetical protein